MNVLSVILSILPLFLIMLLGVFVRKVGIFDWQTTKRLSAFIVNITQPFLIIASFITERTGDKLKIALVIIAASLLMHVSFSGFAALLFRKADQADRSTLEFSLIFGNCAYLGYPVLMAVFPPESGLFYGAVFTLVFNVYIRTYGVFLLNKGKKGSHALLKAFVNPGTIASVIGILLFVFNVRPPEFLTKTFSTVGNLTFPLSMLCVGSLLCNKPLKNLFSGSVYVLSIARLLVLPIVTLVVCLIFRVDTGMTFLCVIMASMPPAANSAIFCEMYKANSPLAASCVGVSSLFSVVTVPAMLALTQLATSALNS